MVCCDICIAADQKTRSWQDRAAAKVIKDAQATRRLAVIFPQFSFKKNLCEMKIILGSCSEILNILCYRFFFLVASSLRI